VPRPATPADGIVWITGASSGIGRAVALQHARAGWLVAATARRDDALSALAEEAAGSGKGRIIPCPGDVTDGEATAELAAAIAAAHGPVARLVANAGAYRPVRAISFDPEDFRASFELNVLGVVHAMAPVLPDMMRRGSGQIAITASVAGYGGLPLASAYGATKAALINLAAGLKFDLDEAGVLMQIICPGFVRTEATASNTFPMPFLMDPDAAAARIMAGLDRRRFEISFPKRFALMLKLLNLLPYGLYFPAVARATGWSGTAKKPAGTAVGS
jgi:short-subunit dehydrogenase